MKDIPCISSPPAIKLCDACSDETIYQIREILRGLGKLNKTMDKASHTTDCASIKPCDCWKDKVMEIQWLT
jgi:hypothetical protein